MKNEGWIVERYKIVNGYGILLLASTLVPSKQAFYKAMLIPPQDFFLSVPAAMFETPPTSDYGEVVGWYHAYVNECKQYTQKEPKTCTS